MTLSSHARRAAYTSVAALVVCASAAAAQRAPGVTAGVRDSLLNCAARFATDSGFLPAPNGRRQDRVGMMRTRSTPEGTMVDGLRIVVPSPDSVRAALLEVNVTTFFMPRGSPFSRKDVAPAPALVALADSIRLWCLRRSLQAAPIKR